ncbi:MAG: DNA-binding protein [Treponematales bacterium]
MTSLRALLAFNMKEKRRVLGLSQAKLAEKVTTSTHYIGMIELERKFPSPEMLERIAAALGLDAPELFSMKTFPHEAVRKFQEQVLEELQKVITGRLTELREEEPPPPSPQAPERDSRKGGEGGTEAR